MPVESLSAPNLHAGENDKFQIAVRRSFWPAGVLLILMALLLSSLPYLYGALRHAPSARYTGMRPINASDYNAHLSFIDQSRKGHFFLRNLYTSQPHDPYLVRPVYFLLSVPFRYIDCSNGLAFHIMRVFCGLLLLLTVLMVLRGYAIDRKTRLFAALLLLFSSGLGFVFHQQLGYSADIDIPESFLFPALGEAPHFQTSLLFLWVGLYCFYRTREKGIYLAGYFAALLILWWDHPFEAVLLVLVAVCASWLVPGLKRKILLLIGIGFVSLPPFLYYRNMVNLPAFAGWTSNQNLMLSPPLLSYASAFVPLAALALPGAAKLWRDPEKRMFLGFLATWAIVQFVSLYLPFSFQRRLVAGLQFPLAILAAYGLIQVRYVWVKIAMIAFLSITNITIAIDQIRQIEPQRMPFYLPDDYSTAFEWLRKQPLKGPVISAFVTGNFIPAETGFASFMGHSSFTPNVVQRRKEAESFFRNPTVDFAKRYNIRYVFYGLEEKAMEASEPPSVFTRIYSNSTVSIFAVPERE